VAGEEGLIIHRNVYCGKTIFRQLLPGGYFRPMFPRQNSIRVANWKALGPPEPKNPPAVLTGE
jgi:hypothetical protein